ncbi:ribonucleotide reductase inhibitor-domain-containing protein [Immersiella caudata]|uniref:Ribonucleotide reductase inhibitor-domain-containing protein n=1 Tax=Immersiella caudata TaxID=314043 RepID=A0AA39XGA6_9PEZI|nr:ribonucleotide reductase inhibitor-domain-containing protein [Immersiella caudata]
MSGPRTKRQFAGASSDPNQRQITSFFSKADPSASTPDVSSPPLNGPVIPANVQSNLLSVGMRVRKSVVEGYKTDPSAYSGFALWSESTPSSDTLPVASNPSAPFYSPRELAPFCGINKVGGLAVQPVSATPNDYNMTSSQESTSSNTSATEAMTTSATATKKRVFVEEEDGIETATQPWREWGDGEISPRSFAPSGWGNARVMATPKTRSRKSVAAAAQTSSLAELGQENMFVDDFDEAPFLSYGQGPARDMEIE